MVNITHKSSTLRIAIATGIVKVSDQKTIDAIQNKLVPKGDVFEFSRAAGLLACKKTYEVVPDCHPLPIEFTSIKHGINGLEIKITVEVHTVYKTGVEVEAMHGVMITALTMYDMLKPIDKHVEILNVQLEEKKGGKTDIKYAYPETLKVAVITCSDSIHHGIGEDKSGIIVVDHLEKHHLSVTNKKVIADDFITIQNEAKDLVNDGYQLIIFTGGTGLSSRDVTPDAISPLIEREVPGVMEAARNYGQQRTPYAMLSRGIAGFVGDSLIITLPGSPKGAEESMNAIFPYILHVFRVKEGVKH
jgi:molybdenum cofactor biosynthesis protein MoaC